MFSPDFWERIWYTKNVYRWILLPISFIFIAGVKIRSFAFSVGLVPVQRLEIPVIIVGNISVGGTGKTPLVIWLIKYLRECGFNPGVVSGGYGGKSNTTPQQVRPDSLAELVGDEPVLIARRTHAPVVVCKKRNLAASELIRHNNIDIILCDDGLQHYALHRDLEIAVINGRRQFGNGFCLPAGPLREPLSRLNNVDLVVSNGKEAKNQYKMEYMPGKLHLVIDDEMKKKTEEFSAKDVHAVAGIGDPERFFSLLSGMNYRVIKHPYPDHYLYRRSDLDFGDDLPVIMTEKDAVKCREFARDNHWYLPIHANLSNTFEHRLNALIKEITHG